MKKNGKRGDRLQMGIQAVFFAIAAKRAGGFELTSAQRGKFAGAEGSGVGKQRKHK